MIPRLNQASLSFKANEAVSPREAYDTLMNKNSQTAQKQNNFIANSAFSPLANNVQIPMQGVGQKLDVIA